MTYADCLAFTWRGDNDGTGYHTTPNDPGAGTAWGVTVNTWVAWARIHGIRKGMAAATKADLSPLLHAWFFAPAGDGLPSGVDLMVWDFGITSGPARSVRYLQAVLDIEQDGVCGPVTKAAAAAFDARLLCQRLHDRQAAFYRAEPDFAVFGDGWLRRCADRLGVALANTPYSTQSGLP